MTTIRTLMLLVAAMGTAALAGCGADVPQKPSWEVDVFPVVKARCVRCHNAQETPDPLSPVQNVLGNFDHASYSDFAQIDKLLFGTAPLYIVNDAPADAAASDPKMHMPPPPAATLAQWQIDTITRFVKNNASP